jgi:fatty-acyl-CoA synthase
MFEDGWLVSGDLGHLDAQGYVHVTRRAKDLIIRGSHKIDPGLVEDAFLAHPAVAMCAAVAGQVYEHPAVPHRVVVLDALPLTAVGKVYKPALRLRVTQLKLAEVFAATAPGLAFAVKAREQGSAAIAEVQLECAPEAEVTERLRAALGAIAVETRFVFRA